MADTAVTIARNRTASLSLEEQARGPLFAKNEMNLADEAELVSRLRSAPYAAELRAAFADQCAELPALQDVRH